MIVRRDIIASFNLGEWIISSSKLPGHLHYTYRLVYRLVICVTSCSCDNKGTAHLCLPRICKFSEATEGEEGRDRVAVILQADSYKSVMAITWLSIYLNISWNNLLRPMLHGGWSEDVMEEWVRDCPWVLPWKPHGFILVTCSLAGGETLYFLSEHLLGVILNMYILGMIVFIKCDWS